MRIIALQIGFMHFIGYHKKVEDNSFLMTPYLILADHMWGLKFGFENLLYGFFLCRGHRLDLPVFYLGF